MNSSLDSCCNIENPLLAAPTQVKLYQMSVSVDSIWSHIQGLLHLCFIQYAV